MAYNKQRLDMFDEPKRTLYSQIVQAVDCETIKISFLESDDGAFISIQYGPVERIHESELHLCLSNTFGTNLWILYPELVDADDRPAFGIYYLSTKEMLVDLQAALDGRSLEYS